MRYLFLVIFLAVVACQQSKDPPPVIRIDFDSFDAEASLAIQQQQSIAMADQFNYIEWQTLGKLFHAHGVEEEAVKMYSYANTLQADQETTYLLGVALARLGHYQEAIHTVEQVKSYEPAIWRQGNWYLDLGELDSAKKYFEKAIEQNPKAAAAYVGLARTYLQLSLETFQYHHRATYQQSKQKLYSNWLEHTLDSNWLDSFRIGL